MPTVEKGERKILITDPTIIEGFLRDTQVAKNGIGVPTPSGWKVIDSDMEKIKKYAEEQIKVGRSIYTDGKIGLAAIMQYTSVHGPEEQRELDAKEFDKLVRSEEEADKKSDERLRQRAEIEARIKLEAEMKVKEELNKKGEK